MSTDPDPADVHEVLRARNRQIAAVHMISRLLSSSLDLEDRLRDILNVALDAVGAGAGTIYLHRDADDMLVFRYVVGEKAAELVGHAMHAANGLAGAVFRSGISQITNRPQDAAEHDTAVEERTGFTTTSIVTVPIQYQPDRRVGVLQLLNKRGGQFDRNDLAVLEIVASVAAAAIETAHLAREAQSAAIAHAVGDLSHDIKNKVSPIALAVYTLRPDMDEMFAALDAITASVTPEHARRLHDATATVRATYGETFDIVTYQVDAVQEYTKLIADALKGTVSEPQLEPTDLAALIDDQLRELEATARNRGVTLLRRLADVPPCRFDRFRIERAVYNLVSNAIPATPAGGSVTVATTLRRDGRFPDGGFVAIEVCDTGHGLARDDLDRILRGDPRSTKPGGTGLGTRIVYNAVIAHRGALEGESREGAGTTFRIKLPLLVA